jgi:hypothetical protein
MPEWQGAGVGLRFLNAVCEMWLRGKNRYAKPMQTLFHTSHPGLAAALRRDPKWSQISAVLFGDSKRRSIKTLHASHRKNKSAAGPGSGFGGHFRAVQGFRYYGEDGAQKKKTMPGVSARQSLQAQHSAS